MIVILTNSTCINAQRLALLGGWRETGSETEKNCSPGVAIFAQPTSRPVHAVLARFLIGKPPFRYKRS